MQKGSSVKVVEVRRAQTFTSNATAAAVAGLIFFGLTLDVSARQQTIGDLTLRMDEAQVIDVPAHTTSIVVGNAAIVDANIVPGTSRAVLTAKSFGVTNILFLDQHGNVVQASNLNITPNSTSSVSIQNGRERATYHCKGKCAPKLAIGDSSSHFGSVQSQITARGNGAVAGE